MKSFLLSIIAVVGLGLMAEQVPQQNPCETTDATSAWKSGAPMSGGEIKSLIGDATDTDSKPHGHTWSEELSSEEIITLFVEDELTNKAPLYQMTRKAFDWSGINSLGIDEKATFVWRAWELRRGAKLCHGQEIKRINAQEKMKVKPDMANVYRLYPRITEYYLSFAEREKGKRMLAYLADKKVTYAELLTYMDEKTEKSLESKLRILKSSYRRRHFPIKREANKEAKSVNKDTKQNGPPSEPYRVNKSKTRYQVNKGRK